MRPNDFSVGGSLGVLPKPRKVVKAAPKKPAQLSGSPFLNATKNIVKSVQTVDRLAHNPQVRREAANQDYARTYRTLQTPEGKNLLRWYRWSQATNSQLDAQKAFENSAEGKRYKDIYLRGLPGSLADAKSAPTFTKNGHYLRAHLLSWAIKHRNHPVAETWIRQAGGYERAKSIVGSGSDNLQGWHDYDPKLGLAGNYMRFGKEIGGSATNDVAAAIPKGVRRGYDKYVGKPVGGAIEGATRFVEKNLPETVNVNQYSAGPVQVAAIGPNKTQANVATQAASFVGHTAANLVKHPKENIADFVALPEAIIGGVGQVAYDTAVAGSGSPYGWNIQRGQDRMAGLKHLGNQIKKDYSERYGPLLKGDYAEYAKRMDARKSVIPEVLDASLLVGSGGAVTGRVAGALAKQGRLGARAERLMTAERPLLRTAGGVVEHQNVSPNLFRAAGQRLEDIRRTKQFEKESARDIANGNGVRGLTPGPGEVVPLRYPLGSNPITRRFGSRRLSNQYRLGNKVQGRVSSEKTMRGDEMRNDVVELPREMQRVLNNQELDALHFVSQGLVKLDEKGGIDIAGTSRILKAYRSSIKNERDVALRQAEAEAERGGKPVDSSLIGSFLKTHPKLQRHLDVAAAIDRVLADPEAAFTQRVVDYGLQSAEHSRGFTAGVNEGTAARRRALPQAVLALKHARPSIREVADELIKEEGGRRLVETGNARAILKSVNRRSVDRLPYDPTVEGINNRVFHHGGVAGLTKETLFAKFSDIKNFVGPNPAYLSDKADVVAGNARSSDATGYARSPEKNTVYAVRLKVKGVMDLEKAVGEYTDAFVKALEAVDGVLAKYRNPDDAVRIKIQQRIEALQNGTVEMGSLRFLKGILDDLHLYPSRFPKEYGEMLFRESWDAFRDSMWHDSGIDVLTHKGGQNIPHHGEHQVVVLMNPNAAKSVKEFKELGQRRFEKIPGYETDRWRPVTTPKRLFDETRPPHSTVSNERYHLAIKANSSSNKIFSAEQEILKDQNLLFQLENNLSTEPVTEFERSNKIEAIQIRINKNIERATEEAQKLEELIASLKKTSDPLQTPFFKGSKSYKYLVETNQYLNKSINELSSEIKAGKHPSDRYPIEGQAESTLRRWQNELRINDAQLEGAGRAGVEFESPTALMARAAKVREERYPVPLDHAEVAHQKIMDARKAGDERIKAAEKDLKKARSVKRNAERGIHDSEEIKVARDELRRAERSLKSTELERENYRGRVHSGPKGKPNYGPHLPLSGANRPRSMGVSDRLAALDRYVADAREAVKVAKARVEELEKASVKSAREAEKAASDAVKVARSEVRDEVTSLRNDLMENEQRYYEEFADEVAKQAEKYGLPVDPAYWRHKGIERERFGDLTSGPGIRYVDDLAKTDLTRLKLGIYDMRPAAFEAGLAATAKRAMSIMAITENIEKLGLKQVLGEAVPKNLRLHELVNWMVAHHLDINDYFLFNPRKALDDSLIGRGDSPYFIDPKDLVEGKNLRVSTELGPEASALTSLSPDVMAESPGWVAVSREAGGHALELDAKGSDKFGRLYDKFRAFNSWTLLATSIPWFTMQRIVDLYAYAAANKMNPVRIIRGLVNYPLVWHSLTPDMQDVIKFALGAGQHRRVARMGSMGRDFSRHSFALQEIMRLWDKFQQTGIAANGKRVPFALLELDSAITKHFKRAQFLNEAERIASRQRFFKFRESMGLVMASMKRVMGVLRKPMTERIKSVVADARTFEEAVKHVLRAFGDWHNLSGVERSYPYRLIMFYPMVRFLARTLFHTLPVRHPLMSLLLLQLARLHKDETEARYKDAGEKVPSWAFSNVYTPEGKKINLARISPVSALGLDLAQAFASLFTGEAEGHGPRGLITSLPPTISTALEAALGQEMLTGRSLRMGSSTQESDPFGGGLSNSLATWFARYAKANPMYDAFMMQMTGGRPVGDNSLPWNIHYTKYASKKKQQEAEDRIAAKGSPTSRGLYRTLFPLSAQPDNTLAILQAQHKRKAKKKPKGGFVIYDEQGRPKDGSGSSSSDFVIYDEQGRKVE